MNFCCTGNFVCDQGEQSAATPVLQFMKNHDLFVVNTNFRKRSHATYLHVVTQGSTDVNLGHKVKVQWQDTEHFGKVIENYSDKNGERMWRVKFDDGYVKSCKESEFDDILILQNRVVEGSQLDYIMVTNRWLTSVQDVTVKWAPSEHGNIHDRRTDHVLACYRWTWRLQSPKPEHSSHSL